MASHVRIPAPLRAYTQQTKVVDLAGNTVAEVLDALIAKYPDLKPHLFDDKGQLRRFVNVFLEDEDVRHLDGPKTVVPANSTLSIIPSVSGG